MPDPDDLALLGGAPVIDRNDIPAAAEAFRWPIIGDEDHAAVSAVMDLANFEGSGNVEALENEFAEFCGVRHGVGQVNGTNAVLAALWACGVGPGDEVLVPTTTYWATATPAYLLGAAPVFVDVDGSTMNIDPDALEEHVTDRTKAVVVVHMLGHPADMERIVRVARRHRLRVVEDASHAHGSLYRGRRVGGLGDIAAFSFSGKPIATGEGGIVVTDDDELYERVVAWGQNFRFHEKYVRDPDLLRYAGMPLGHVTSRLHPLSAAMARVQLRHLPARMAEVDEAMTAFWDSLAGVPGLRPHRPPPGEGTTMGAWYQPHGLYRSEELGGLSVTGFIRAVRAEGFPAWSRNIIREPLHAHPAFNQPDTATGRYLHNGGAGRPFPGRRELPGARSLRAFSVPPFKHHRPELVERYSRVFRKVVERHEQLLPGDPGDGSVTVDERGNG